MRSRREVVSGASAKIFTPIDVRMEPTRLLHEADTSELGYGLLNFIRFKFTTDQPISYLAAVIGSAFSFVLFVLKIALSTTPQTKAEIE